MAINAGEVVGGDAPAMFAFAATGLEFGGIRIFGFASGFATGRSDEVVGRSPGLSFAQRFEFGHERGYRLIESGIGTTTWRRRRIGDGESGGHGDGGTCGFRRITAHGVDESNGSEAVSAFLDEPVINLLENEAHALSADEVFGHVVLHEGAQGAFAEAEVLHDATA